MLSKGLLVLRIGLYLPVGQPSQVGREVIFVVAQIDFHALAVRDGRQIHFEPVDPPTL